MKKPNPKDAPQLAPRDTVVLLVGGYDPPHLGYFHAACAFLDRPKVKEVWLAPFSTKKRGQHVSNMVGMLAIEATSATKRMVAICTAGLDKNYHTSEEVAAWCRNTRPTLDFKVAKLGGSPGAADYVVRFANQQFKEDPRVEIVSLEKMLPQPDDLAERIKKGKDESRSFSSSIWDYIQAYRLYREK